MHTTKCCIAAVNESVATLQCVAPCRVVPPQSVTAFQPPQTATLFHTAPQSVTILQAMQVSQYFNQHKCYTVSHSIITSGRSSTVLQQRKVLQYFNQHSSTTPTILQPTQVLHYITQHHNAYIERSVIQRARAERRKVLPEEK